VYADFIEQAEPWLAQMTTVEGVAREFYKLRIGPVPSGETRPPDPYAWAQYGWLLQESGKPEEGRPWLQRALDFLRQPAHMQAGRLVVYSLPGSTPIPMTAEDNRLLELLNKGLAAN
jgi:hypothetical protein